MAEVGRFASVERLGRLRKWMKRRGTESKTFHSRFMTLCVHSIRSILVYSMHVSMAECDYVCRPT